MSDAAWRLVIVALRHLPTLLIFSGSCAGLARFRRLSPSLRALALLACFETVAELASLALWHLQKPNLFLIPLIMVGEVGLQALLYARALQSRRFWRVAPWAVGLVAVYALLDSLLVPGSVRYRPSVQVLGALLPLGLAGLYFRKLLNELQVTRLERDPLFWVSAGLAIASLGDLLIALFSSYLSNNYSAQLNITIWSVHAWLVGFLYCTYCLALWMRPPKPNSGSYYSSASA